METDFWLDRWDAGQTAWQQAHPNPALSEFWEPRIPTGQTVFVPLCGASVDMAWLADHGHRVVGIDLSQLAAAEFFEQVGLEPHQRVVGDHTVLSAGPYEFWVGDLFGLGADALSGVTAVYDRASLVALPPEMRQRYAAYLAATLPAGVQWMLLTFEYDQAEMSGPPFSVEAAEVASLFGDTFDVELLAHRRDVLGRNADLGQRGVSALFETVTLLSS